MNDRPRRARPTHHPSPGDHLGPPQPVLPLSGAPPSPGALCPILTSLFQGIMKKLACNLRDLLPTAAPRVAPWLWAAYGSLEYLPKSLFTPIICREIKL